MKRVAAILMCATVAACSGVQTQLDPAGDQAAALHRLFLLMMLVCGAVYALVIAALGWSLWRARRSPDTPAGDRARPRATRPSSARAAVATPYAEPGPRGAPDPT